MAIGTIKNENGLIRIYNTSGSQTGTISVSSSATVNYTSDSVSVTDNSLTRIYDEQGNQTGTV
jgi:hypothetical protein